MASSGVEGYRGWSIQPKQLLWKLSDRARHLGERGTLTPEAALGRRGEDLAHRYLRSCGYTVVARNYKPGADSEIDIVARASTTLVFVEVKSRQSAEFGSPDRAVDGEKQRHIIRAARSFVARSGDSWNNVRFDVIAIVFSQPPAVSHYRDVFFQGRALGSGIGE
ncbi:MAG: YraN family protein [Acidobacteriota bacterium]|nr:YraN family protein [Acidobacteriota bacterium]